MATNKQFSIRLLLTLTLFIVILTSFAKPTILRITDAFNRKPVSLVPDGFELVSIKWILLEGSNGLVNPKDKVDLVQLIDDGVKNEYEIRVLVSNVDVFSFFDDVVTKEPLVGILLKNADAALVNAAKNRGIVGACYHGEDIEPTDF